MLAQFISGSLPGSVPTPTDASTSVSLVVEAGAPKSLQVTLTQFAERYVFQGQGNVPIAGIASTDVSAVALALDKLGTGYWVVPVGPLDTATQQPTWTVTADFGVNIPEGFRNLNFVGIDGNGNAGTIQSLKICMASRVPDGFQGCASNPKPPAAVISLSWDTNVDLDLQVMTPDGTLVEPKNPATVVLDAGVTTLPSNAGRIDRDSNGYCVIDNIRYENLIWRNVAPTGNYGIYVNLFDACKQPAVHFNVQVYTAVSIAGADGGTTQALRSWYSADGILLDFQANGGSNIGFFVTDFNFQ